MDEGLLPRERPESAALRLSRIKARAVAPLFPSSRILAADTVVALDGAILGKPSSLEEAAAILGRLSGREHRVITGVTLTAPGMEDSFAVTTEVVFRPLRREEIEAYVATGEPMDKAGAYGIQGKAAGFVLSIRGSYTNVVGLPLAECLLRLQPRGTGA